MRFFLCLLQLDYPDIPESLRRNFEAIPRSRGLPFQWRTFSHGAVLIGGDARDGEALVESDGDCVAVGTVRLDNRLHLERQAGCHSTTLSDLALVLRTVVHHGPRYVPQFLGDFAFLVWNPGIRTAIAACDAFAVKKLYYSLSRGFFAFASRGEVLALDERYDSQYLAERVAVCTPTTGLTPYAGVKSLPGGHLALLERGNLTTQRYWSAHDFDVAPGRPNAERESAETCRELLAESVRLRLGGAGDTWAQLSGGLDSSSVVGVAQWLATQGDVPHGLAGTVSFADSHGTGADEREYSDAVATLWRVRNETIIDSPIWHDDHYAPPHIDEPSAALAVHPRNHRLCAIVRGAGGRVLLTGVGGDELFTGTMFFFADWVARGRIWSAAREMARRAAIGRVSFWELAYRNAILPLLPRSAQYRLVRDDGQMPPWLAPLMVRRHHLRSRAVAPVSYAGRVGRKYHDALAAGVAAISSGLLVGLVEDTLDVRHPFLFRPLVEFALRLPAELCARPSERKWIVREAMRGILPEVVRRRVGKGVIVGLFAWSTVNQQELLRPLIRDPILADLGVIDASRLQAAFAAAQHERANRERLSGAVQNTLAIEAWLQMRSGRWPRRSQTSSETSTEQVHAPSA